MLRGVMSRIGTAAVCLCTVFAVTMTAKAEDSAKIAVSATSADQKVTVGLSEASWYGSDMSVTCYAPGYNAAGSVADNAQYVVYLDQIKAAASFAFTINKGTVSGNYKLILGCNGAKLEKEFTFGTGSGQNQVTTTNTPGSTTAVTTPVNNTGSDKLKAPKAKVKAGKKKATVSWNKIKGAKGYKIYMSLKKNKGFKVKATVKAKKTKCVIKKLKKGKTYYFKVAAYKGSGKKTVIGKMSKAVKAKIK